MNARKLLSMLLSAVMAVTVLAGCGGGKNYSKEAAKAANAAQNTVVFSTDTTLANALQDALEDHTQVDDVKAAMVADESLKSLLTSGYQLDVFAAQGEDAAAAAKTIAENYIVNIVAGKNSAGKIAMVLHDGNGYYYVATLTYTGGNGGSGSGSDSDDGSGDDEPVTYTVTVNVGDNGTAKASATTVNVGESCTITATPASDRYQVGSVTAVDKDSNSVSVTDNGDNKYTISNINSDITVTVTFTKVPSVLTSIEVTQSQSKNLYVGQTLTADHLTYTAYDQFGDVMDAELTFSTASKTSFSVVGNETISVTYKDADGKTYTDEEVDITVKQPTVDKVELIVPTNEKFYVSTSLFWNGSKFRDGFEIKITYKESDVDSKYVDVVRSMHKDLINDVAYENMYNDNLQEWLPYFQKYGEQIVRVKYRETLSSDWHTFDVTVNVSSRWS